MGASWGHLGGHLGRILGVLSHLGDILEASWRHLGPKGCPGGVVSIFGSILGQFWEPIFFFYNFWGRFLDQFLNTLWSTFGAILGATLRADRPKKAPKRAQEGHQVFERLHQVFERLKKLAFAKTLNLGPSWDHLGARWAC